jgi:hypothetical protein
VFVNGIASGTPASNAGALNTNALSVRMARAENTPTSRGISGYVSDLRVTTNSALYVSNFTTSLPTAPLRPLTNTVLLLNMTDPAITDTTMMGNLVTVASVKSTTALVKKYNSTNMYFNGTSDYMTVPANPALSMGSGDFTWEMWVYPLVAPSGTSTLSNQMLFGYRSGNDTSPYLTYNAGAGGTNLNVGFGGDTTTFINSNATLTLNQWNHLAVTRAGTSLIMFINGIIVGSATNSTNFSDTSIRYIGAMNSTPYYFSGYIDDLRITKGVARYTASFQPPTIPPKLR